MSWGNVRSRFLNWRCWSKHWVEGSNPFLIEADRWSMDDKRGSNSELPRSAHRNAPVHFASGQSPYIELAMKLSSMSRDKLRSVAEDLLDITL